MSPKIKQKSNTFFLAKKKNISKQKNNTFFSKNRGVQKTHRPAKLDPPGWVGF